MSDFAKVGELYTPINTALQMLAARREDRVLVNRVKKYFSQHIAPAEIDAQPCLVYAPALVTPNIELLYLKDIAQALPYPIRYFEFSHDKFVHLNFAKRSLANLVFIDRTKSGERIKTSEITILDLQTAQGKPMNEIETLSGENFVDFHHRILNSYLKSESPEIIDFSNWFSESYKFDISYPYLRYLSLFLTDGILLANFTTEKREAIFTESRVIPAFRKLHELFGISPLIVPIQPTESDDELFWCYYPDEVRPFC